MINKTKMKTENWTKMFAKIIWSIVSYYSLKI